MIVRTLTFPNDRAVLAEIADYSVDTLLVAGVSFTELVADPALGYELVKKLTLRGGQIGIGPDFATALLTLTPQKEPASE